MTPAIVLSVAQPNRRTGQVGGVQRTAAEQTLRGCNADAEGGEDSRTTEGPGTLRF